MFDEIMHLIRQFNHGWFVLHYVTLRCVLAALTAFFVAVFFGPGFIRWLGKKQMRQMVREDGPPSHLNKQGTPTMGGVLIVGGIGLAAVLWCDLANLWIQVMLTGMFGFAVIGAVDDLQKIRKANARGLSAGMKLLAQTAMALLLMLILYHHVTVPAQVELVIPLMKEVHFSLGWGLVPFGVLVIVGTSNAVNLTDGLDGLVTMPVILVAAGLGVFAYLSGHSHFAQYLLIPQLPHMSEISVFCAAIVGAGLGFLWFNAYPAQVFMGDMGSLSLGACLGLVAVLVRQELLLAIMGAVFVFEAISVMIQVGVYKCTGNRVFRMAPLHHHFELKGIPEAKVIVRFWIVTLVLVILCLATLKLR